MFPVGEVLVYRLTWDERGLFCERCLKAHNVYNNFRDTCSVGAVFSFDVSCW